MRHFGDRDAVDLVQKEDRPPIDLDSFERLEREISVFAQNECVVGANDVRSAIEIGPHDLDAMTGEPPVGRRHAIGKREEPRPERPRLIALVETLVYAKEDLVGEVFEIVRMNAEMSEAVPHVVEVLREDRSELRPDERGSDLHSGYLSRRRPIHHRKR
jgi:hypothetical protein